ncbi:MAG TPA: hypothetical protein VFK37_01980, partial [Bacillales bacterium]|nr:hypothetical protein [Bacillales bacterium]
MIDRKIVDVMDHLFEFRNALMESLIPEEAQRHFQSSKREALCGLRDLIQHAIDKLEGQPSK